MMMIYKLADKARLVTPMKKGAAATATAPAVVQTIVFSVTYGRVPRNRANGEFNFNS
jgi:hypothetical protein